LQQTCMVLHRLQAQEASRLLENAFVRCFGRCCCCRRQAIGEGLEPPADPEALTAPGEALLIEERVMGASAKVVDFGNACWVHKQFTSDIQTRQYRCPEVRPAETSGLLQEIQRCCCFTISELCPGRRCRLLVSGRRLPYCKVPSVRLLNWHYVQSDQRDQAGQKGAPLGREDGNMWLSVSGQHDSRMTAAFVYAAHSSIGSLRRALRRQSSPALLFLHQHHFQTVNAP
jgi:hypothetical protein